MYIDIRKKIYKKISLFFPSLSVIILLQVLSINKVVFFSIVCNLLFNDNEECLFFVLNKYNNN